MYFYTDYLLKEFLLCLIWLEVCHGVRIVKLFWARLGEVRVPVNDGTDTEIRSNFLTATPPAASLPKTTPHFSMLNKTTNESNSVASKVWRNQSFLVPHFYVTLDKSTC